MKGVAVITIGEIRGYVEFIQCTHTTKVVVHLDNVPKGYHGFHIHEYGDLRDGCTSTCSHFNPYGTVHGGTTKESGPHRHVGDLGNIKANSRGKVRQTIYEPTLQLSHIVGRSVVIHENEDDLGEGMFEDSLTTGHSGKRIGCGVIGWAKA